MTDLPSDLQARRTVEDELARLGADRKRLEAEEERNIEAIVAALPEAIDTGIPFEGIANLVGVSRQTLYRWQAVAQQLRRDAEEEV
jgi:hypothetical protein